jgi:hypothetical protein
LRNISLIGALVLLLSACGTVKFQQLALYDSYEQPAPEEKSVSIIFEDAEGTMWNSLFECGDFAITNKVAYEGKSSIKISWAKTQACEWIGFGNSFSNWAPSDMSEERMNKALTFYVRTQSESASSIPIVAALEDFGGGGSYHFLDASKYLHGLQIDTNWKQMIVPLWDFPVHEDEVDIYSIKQMKFQLEGAGSFYLDDIRLIDYTKEQYQEMRDKVELMKPKGEVEQVVYTEGNLVEDAWGHKNNPCQSLTEITESNNQCIKWEVNSADCNWATWGINWNGWYQANFRGISDKAKLTFKVKAAPASDFKIKLEDYRGHSVEVFASGSAQLDAGKWRTIEVPLKSLNLKEKGFALDQIKQLTFRASNGGTIYLDDIKITSL